MNKPAKSVIIVIILVVIAVVALYISGRNNEAVVISETSTVGEEGGREESTEEEKFDVPIQKKEFTEFGSFWLEIKTDDLEIKAPVLNSVDKPALRRGIGRHESTALPNPEKGNIVLSGHRWIPGSNPANTVFRHLDKLSVGDEVSLFYEGKEYVYRVQESKTVSNDAVEILEDSDTPQLTLYTCTPVFTALKRLVYVADLIEVR